MDSKSAAAYLIDPLHAPEPSQETGPGTHFVRPDEPPVSAASSTNTNPFRRSSQPPSPINVSKSNGVSTHVRQVSRDSTAHSPSPFNPNSSTRSSPRSAKFPDYREQALSGLNDSPPPRRSNDQARLPTYEGSSSGGRRRGSSLKERFPGDESHKPLDIIRRDSRKAHRSPHLNKRHIPGADLIDRLDPTINKIPYHHEGPYDAASLARNTGPEHARPVAALKESNEEAMKATAPEVYKDAVEHHKPIAGVADVPPGMTDKMGRTYDYQEGANQMFEGLPDGEAYKRYPGRDYHPDDVHGQGEPSFSLDRALRAHTIHEREFDGQRGIELSDRPLMSDHDHNGKGHRKSGSLDTRDPVVIAGNDARYADLQYAADVDAHPVKRSGSLKDGIKRRIGSIRRKGLDEFLP